MASDLILSWDDSELRYLATDGTPAAVVQSAGTLPLAFTSTTDADERPETETRPAIVDWQATMDALRKQLAGVKVGRTAILLARSQIECLYLELPRATDAELLLLVRNQVFRETTGTDLDPVDYIAFDDATSERRRVMAVTTPHTKLRQWMVACAKGGFALRRIGYRPEMIAILAAEIGELPDKTEPSDANHLTTEPSETRDAVTTLVVARSGDEIDLGGVVAGRLVALRTVRLAGDRLAGDRLAGGRLAGGDATEQRRQIASEVRRTVLVGWDATTPAIGRVLLWGNDAAWRDLLDDLAPLNASLDFPVATTDGDLPPELSPHAAAARSWRTPRATRIDLLHPKEPPRPVNVARLLTLTAVVLVVACGILFAVNRSQIAAIQKCHDTLVAQYDATATSIAQIAPVYQVLSRTDAWERANLSWLDELRLLSLCLPESTDLTITRMTFAANTPRRNQPYTGVVTLTGMVRDPAVLRTLQSRLQATQHYLMPSPTPTPNPAGGGYPWLFTASIYCYPVADKSVYGQ